MIEGKKVLVIDDSESLCTMIALSFEGAGADVELAYDGRVGLRRFFEFRPDLVILDIMMPGMDGWEVCYQIRLLSDTPIIILTALQSDVDIVQGLDAGADDFVHKPFSANVLLARARAVLRRAKPDETEAQQPVYEDDELTIDLATRQLTVRKQLVKLTATEFRLMAYLIQNAGITLTYKQILEHVWGWSYRDSIDYVHVYLSHLRRKIEQDPRNPEYLLNEHGVGYRFVPKV